jgi:hypothetical protein
MKHLVTISLMVLGVLGILQIAPAPSWALESYFYGLDIASGGDSEVIKTDFDKLGWKTSNTTNIKPSQIWNDMKEKMDKYNPETGKFTSTGGVYFIYLSTHGAATDDGKDTWVSSGNNSTDSIKFSELAANIANAMPADCLVVFTADLCGINGWRNNYIEPPDGESVNPNNPFKNLNYIVAVPSADDITFSSPIGYLEKEGFDKKRTAMQYYEYLSNGKGCAAWWSMDDKYKNFVIIPEPATLLLLGLGAAIIRKRKV